MKEDQQRDPTTEQRDIAERLWESDVASALTNEGAREIERLRDQSAARFAEIVRLRAWLQLIADRHLGDQPAALNLPAEDWAKRHIRTLCRFAMRGLKGETVTDDL